MRFHFTAIRMVNIHKTMTAHDAIMYGKGHSSIISGKANFYSHYGY